MRPAGQLPSRVIVPCAGLRRTALRPIGLRTTVACVLLALAACGGDHGRATGDTAASGDDASLPKPAAASGSVTGMPETPGPGRIGPPDPAMADAMPVDGIPIDGLPVDPALAGGDVVLDANGLPIATEDTGAAMPGAADAAAMPAEPSPQDAVAVVREYYAAIDAQQYGRAYALWSGAGGSSGQTPQQFADGFANTIEVIVESGAPGRIDAAAGSRFIQVPVSVQATRRDGSVHRYAGSYTLRRAVVDGASAEQRAWRIASADLREVQP